MTDVLLASTSPSRLSLLTAAGLAPLVSAPGVDEDAVVEHERPETVAAQALLLAHAKGEAVVARLLAGAEEVPGDRDDLLLLASDSLLELDGQPVGKPHTPEAARRVWQRMGGRSAVLHTGHFAARLRRTAPDGWREEGRRAELASTTIRTAAPSRRELEDYIATGEPLEVAGALTIDGLGAAFVEGIDGDHTNVIGLSIPLMRRLAADLGIAWTGLWRGDTPEAH